MAASDLTIKFGSFIRQLRVDVGLTQEALAELAGVHPTYIGLVERGLRNPTLEVADALATALKTTLAEVLIEIRAPRRSPKPRDK